eukprot:m.356516 g.356516  ORF g.356516 m.356516 type:complete len:389 (+) comp17559_c0_seq1:54-1220(+)
MEGNGTLNGTDTGVSGPVLDAGHIVAYTALFLMAVVPIYIGSLKSILHMKHSNKSGETEVLSSEDAAMFTVWASCTLFSLYLAIKFLGKEVVTFAMSIYLLLMGAVSLAGHLEPFVAPFFPKKYLGAPFHLCLKRDVKDKKQQVSEQGQTPSGTDGANTGSAQGKDSSKDHVLFDLRFDNSHILCLFISLAIAVAYFFTKHWLFNNLLGLSFAVSGITILPLGRFQTGCILLSCLFFYDIFWVFGTDVMVTVAKSIQAPIKVCFPKDFVTDGIFGTKEAMLGLGDIVIPGAVIALLARFDDFLKPGSRVYFTTTLVAYVVGFITTLTVMHVFNAAQPALLYLVPACLITPALTAVVRGEFSKLWNYDDEKDCVFTKEEEADLDKSKSD